MYITRMAGTADVEQALGWRSCGLPKTNKAGEYSVVPATLRSSFPTHLCASGSLLTCVHAVGHKPWGQDSNTVDQLYLRVQTGFINFPRNNTAIIQFQCDKFKIIQNHLFNDFGYSDLTVAAEAGYGPNAACKCVVSRDADQHIDLSFK